MNLLREEIEAQQDLPLPTSLVLQVQGYGVLWPLWTKAGLSVTEVPYMCGRAIPQGRASPQHRKVQEGVHSLMPACLVSVGPAT